MATGLALLLALTSACGKDEPADKRSTEEAPHSFDLDEVCRRANANVYEALGVDVSPDDRDTNMRTCTSYLKSVRADYGDKTYRATVECTLRQSKENPRGPFACDPAAFAKQVGE